MSGLDAAREGARRANGQFGTFSLDEGTDGVDLSTGGVDHATATQRAAVDAINASDLGGLAAFDAHNGYIRYLDADGSDFRVDVNTSGISAGSEETNAYAQHAYYFTGEAAPEHIGVPVVAVLSEARRQHRDIDAFNAGVDETLKFETGSAFSAFSRRFDDGMLVIEGAPGSTHRKVSFSDFRFTDPEHDNQATMRLDLIDTEGENGTQTFVVTRSPGSPGSGAEHTFLRGETTQPLADWEARGLEAEINLRAGLNSRTGSLAQTLMNTTVSAADEASRTPRKLPAYTEEQK